MKQLKQMFRTDADLLFILIQSIFNDKGQLLDVCVCIDIDNFDIFKPYMFCQYSGSAWNRYNNW